MDKILVEYVRAVLHYKNLDKSFGVEPEVAAMLVWDKATTWRPPPATTSYDVMFDKKPNLSYLHVFSC